MIEHLTEAQKAKFPEYIEKWTNIGLSTARCDRDAASFWIDKVYEQGGYKPPKYKRWVTSPIQFKEILAEYNEELCISNICYGSNDASWLSSYDFMLRELNIKECEPLIPLINIAEHTFWFYPLDNLCIFSEKPTEIHLKEKRLHHDGGPAIAFDDGGCLQCFALNGVEVPEWLAVTPAQEIDPHKFLLEKNVEVRREIIRKVGIERLIATLGAEKIDEEDDMYELLRFEVTPDGKKGTYLKMKNPSIGVFHIEGVPNDCYTVEDALTWRNGGIKIRPDILT